MGHAENLSQSVLVIEDDEALAGVLKTFLEAEGWQVKCAGTAAEARRVVASEAVFDLVLADYLLPDADGLTVFEEIQQRSPMTKVMLMTGVRDMEVAARAFKQGAADLISKPFRLNDLEKRISQLMDRKSRRLQDEAKSLEPCDQPSSIIGNSAGMNKVLHLIRMVAGKNATVMITGESGTGKELVAQGIHDLSPRSDKPFVAINCAAIPDNLLEDELFGHVRGAYTDARQARIGRFEQANGGTLFLDEIGDMPSSLQVKLLRVLEEKSFQKLGSNQTIRVDFRLLAATNSDLHEKLKNGEFRTDLFYRINVVPIHIPPLRERKEDIALLVNHFIKRICSQYKVPCKKLDPQALRILIQHQWPGNIRELRNVVELGFVLSENRNILHVEDFPTLTESLETGAEHQQLLDSYLELPEEGIDLNQVVSEVEKNLICQSLNRTGGNKGKAARLLYLKRTTLVEKLRRMNLLEEFSS